VHANQYMDFIRNQRFRCTLLCQKEQPIERNLKTTSVEDFYIQLTGKIDKADFSENDINNDTEISLKNSMLGFKVKSPNAKRVLMILKQQIKPISYQQLCDLVFAHGSFTSMDQVKKMLNEEMNLMRCVLAGLMSISTYPGEYVSVVSEKPIACPFVRYQAQNYQHATNRRHQVVSLDALSKEILPKLDGTITLTDVKNMVIDKIRTGKINLLDKDKKPIAESALQDTELTNHCQQILNNFAKQALLIG
jgi:methyltransferase-like protein